MGDEEKVTWRQRWAAVRSRRKVERAARKAVRPPSRLTGWQKARLWFLTSVTIAVALIVSFTSIQNLAQWAGFGWRSWLFPVLVDVVAAAGYEMWMSRSAARRSAAWLAGFAVTLSLAANVADWWIVSEHKVLPAAMGAVPPLMLAWLLYVVHRHGLVHEETAPVVPEPDELTDPVVQSVHQVDVAGMPMNLAVVRPVEPATGDPHPSTPADDGLVHQGNGVVPQTVPEPAPVAEPVPAAETNGVVHQEEGEARTVVHQYLDGAPVVQLNGAPLQPLGSDDGAPMSPWPRPEPVHQELPVEKPAHWSTKRSRAEKPVPRPDEDEEEIPLIGADDAKLVEWLTTRPDLDTMARRRAETVLTKAAGEKVGSSRAGRLLAAARGAS